MIAMGVTQDRMVDSGEGVGDGTEVGQHPIGRAACQVVVGAAVIDQREVRPAYQDAEAGAGPEADDRTRPEANAATRAQRYD